MFQLLISMVIILVYFSNSSILYKRSTLNISIFTVKQVKLYYINGKKNSANILTKNLDQVLA